MSATNAGTLVTVLTTAHNAERHIEEAIDSIRAQTFTDWEYVIVDDASTDTTPAIIERYAVRDSRIRMIRRTTNGGTYVAANQGFAAAKGKYVARLDADDVAVPDRLANQLKFLEANPELRACASEIMFLEDGRSRPIKGEFPSSPGSLKWRLFFRTFLPSTTFIERPAWSDVGGFRELPLSQDLRLWCDLARRHWLGVMAEPVVHWRVHPAQLSAQRYELQQALAVDVLQDHLRQLGQEWTSEDIDRLRWIGVRANGRRDGVRVIARWESMWRRDDRLTDSERQDLERLTRRLRTRHARVALREVLGSHGWGRALLRARRRVIQSPRP